MQAVFGDRRSRSDEGWNRAITQFIGALGFPAIGVTDRQFDNNQNSENENVRWDFSRDTTMARVTSRVRRSEKVHLGARPRLHTDDVARCRCRRHADEQGIAAAQAGAAILHVHARDPRDGRPTPDPAAFLAFLPRLKEGCDAVINVTTGGGLNMTVDDRLKGPVMLRPEMCSLNMGSMNFALYPLADRDQSWKHDWEEPYRRSSKTGCQEHFRAIARIIRFGRRARMPVRARCYASGTLRTWQRGRRKWYAAFFVQLIFACRRDRTGHRQPAVHEQTRITVRVETWSVLRGSLQMPFARNRFSWRFGRVVSKTLDIAASSRVRSRAGRKVPRSWIARHDGRQPTVMSDRLAEGTAAVSFDEDVRRHRASQLRAVWWPRCHRLGLLSCRYSGRPNTPLGDTASLERRCERARDWDRGISRFTEHPGRATIDGTLYRL